MKDKFIHIGTSGWHYNHWRGPFYPVELQPEDFLKFYAGYFHTVEINNSFYQLPRESTFEHWRVQTPEDFFFSVKASRFITHMKKLKDTKEALDNFLNRISTLGDKLGPVIFQLPPGWKCNVDRLNRFLESLPHRYRYAFEFRNPTWFNCNVYKALTEHNAAFCIYELNRFLSPEEVTADFVYIRLHGPEGPYQGKYSNKVLKEWADHFSLWRRRGKEVYCYFDNDQAGYAVQDALRLQKMVK